MNKKVLIFSLVVLGLILIITGLVFWFGNRQEETNLAKNCNPYLNIETIVKTGDKESCDCLNNKAQQSLCKININNTTSYTSAIQQTDLSQCNNISDFGMKATCIKITQGKIDFMKGNLTASSSKIK